MKLGFIGLGIMGKPMARNLMKNGHELVVFDVVRSSVEALAADGALAAATVKEVAQQCSVILTMLPNSTHVESVVMGEEGILSVCKAGSTLIDMSSIAPLASQKVAQACKEHGVRMLEAPVSGGEPKAVEGTLSFMCGGEREVFDECLPLLKLMGGDVVYCGLAGAGNTTKLANQIIVAVNIAGLAEAFMLAKRAGVNPETVMNAIKGGLAGSTVMNAKGPMMIANNTKPGFKLDLHIKDLNNVLETAHAQGAPVPLTALVMEMMQTLRADGMGQCDHSALAKYYEKLASDTIY
ncbi:MAG: 2-hydroxy-3-oxopropionate reductase [Clostridia bacterium]